MIVANSLRRCALRLWRLERGGTDDVSVRLTKELLRRLKRSGLRWPVLAMTAHGDVSTAVRAMRVGGANFVEKPFDDEALLAATEAALGATRRSRRSAS